VGVQSVRVVGASGGLSETQILVGQRAGSPLSAAMERVRFAAGEVELDFAVTYGRYPLRGDLDLELRDMERTVGARQVPVVGGRAQTSFPADAEVPHFLVLQTRVTNQTALVRLAEYDTAPPALQLTTPDAIVPNGSIPVDVSGGDGHGLLLIADARCDVGTLCATLTGRGQLLSSEQLAHVNLRLQTGKLPAGIHRSRTQMPVCRTVALDGFSQSFRLPSPFNVPRWRVLLFTPGGESWQLTERLVEVGYPQGLFLDFPEYVSEGDRVEGIVSYQSDSPGELHIDADGPTRRRLGRDEAGEVPVVLTGRSRGVEVSLVPTEGEPHDDEWQNQAGGDLRLVHHTRFAGAGESFESRRYLLHPDPASLMRNIAAAGALDESPGVLAAAAKLGLLCELWRADGAGQRSAGVEHPRRHRSHADVRRGAVRVLPVARSGEPPARHPIVVPGPAVAGSSAVPRGAGAAPATARVREAQHVAQDPDDRSRRRALRR
jgi:hypothetical protein